MTLGRATLVVGCLIVLAVVGVVTKLVLGDIGKGDTCPYCSASLEPKGEDLCRTVTRLLGKGSGESLSTRPGCDSGSLKWVPTLGGTKGRKIVTEICTLGNQTHEYTNWQITPTLYFGQPSAGLFFTRDFLMANCQLPLILRTSGLGPRAALGLLSGRFCCCCITSSSILARFICARASQADGDEAQHRQAVAQLR
jgi:hypothetical protein